jgi:predicted anti-sigma-YlaC factor YlaD
MNCRQAKADIALWIGEDLPEPQHREELRRHVAACPECRAHYKRMKRTIAVLEHADRAATYDSGDSLWPELSRRIARRPESAPSRFNGWLPFTAMTAACLALVVVMESRPTNPVHHTPISRSAWPTFMHQEMQASLPASGHVAPVRDEPIATQRDDERVGVNEGTF